MRGVTAIVFWDSERITFVEFLERGATDNSERDVQTLTLILLTWRIGWAPNNANNWQTRFNSVFKGLKTWKQRIRMVRPNRKIDQVLLLLLLRDNTQPHTRRHTSPRTREAITTIGWTFLPHPPYSPDLAPSDYHLCGPVKDALGGQPLADNGELKHSLREQLRRFSLILHRRTASHAEVEKVS
jgi:hypothetical protein